MSFKYKETLTTVLFPQSDRFSFFKCKPLRFNHYGGSLSRAICPVYEKRATSPFPQHVQNSTKTKIQH